MKMCEEMCKSGGGMIYKAKWSRAFRGRISGDPTVLHDKKYKIYSASYTTPLTSLTSSSIFCCVCGVHCLSMAKISGTLVLGLVRIS